MKLSTFNTRCFGLASKGWSVFAPLLQLIFLCLFASASGRVSATTLEIEAPRVVALLEQGLAAEQGIRGFKRPGLALALYCEAGELGSAEGFFQVGRILRKSASLWHNPTLGNAYLALAASLGHQQAQELHDPALANAFLPELCGDFDNIMASGHFDLDGYLASLSPARQKIAALIRRHAPRYAVDTRFGLAVALAESNLNPLAVSPKNAQGVMQLIPDTQERFGVKKPFDPESSIRGGLTYLKWLSARFGGDLALVAAAYNAGEGTVDKYKGIPPYPETRHYVRRVLYFSGLGHPQHVKAPLLR
jgi:Transglycosylase SLT domain